MTTSTPYTESEKIVSTSQLQLVQAPVFYRLQGDTPDPRPSPRDEFVRDRAIKLFRPKVEAWLRASSEQWDEHAEKDIRSLLFTSKDGYALAKELEDRRGLVSDRELVEVMDDLGWDEDKALRELTAEWVKACGITVPFAVGDRVRITQTWRPHQREGEVVEINAELAQVKVRTPDCNPATKERWVLDFEEVESVAVTSAETIEDLGEVVL